MTSTGPITLGRIARAAAPPPAASSRRRSTDSGLPDVERTGCRHPDILHGCQIGADGHRPDGHGPDRRRLTGAGSSAAGSSSSSGSSSGELVRRFGRRRGWRGGGAGGICLKGVMDSDAGLVTGEYFLDHQLVTYQSQGQNIGIDLQYSSAQADPTPVVQYQFTTPPAGDSSSITSINAQVSLAGVVQGAATTYNTPDGLTDGETYNIPLQVDASELATGVYTYTMTVTENFGSGDDEISITMHRPGQRQRRQRIQRPARRRLERRRLAAALAAQRPTARS